MFGPLITRFGGGIEKSEGQNCDGYGFARRAVSHEEHQEADERKQYTGQPGGGAWWIAISLAAFRDHASYPPLEKTCHPGLQFWQEFLLKPGIVPDPGGVPPARMRQRHEVGAVASPIAYRFRQASLPLLAEIVGLGIASDQ